LSGQQSELEALVRSRFSVKEFFTLPGGELEFQVAYDNGIKQKFVQLRLDTADSGYRPELTGTKDECVLILRKPEAPAKGGSRLPVLLALFTIATVVVFALVERLNYEQLAPSLSGFFVFFCFALGIPALLGVHELAQQLVARRKKTGRPSSYLIPWVPFLPPFLPSLGFASSQREPALNRDALFDAVIAGPLAILVVAVLLYAIGDLTAVQSPLLFQFAHSANSTNLTNPSIIQMSMDTILGPYLPKAAAGALPTSPFADVATVGFFVIFFAFLPMATFDGGLLSLASLGERASKALTYLSVLALLLLDTPNYWSLAIIVLLLAGRTNQLKLLDDVSDISTSRRWVFLGSVVLAFLCLPIPHNLGTLPLP
jgi:hypothetical protein